MPIKAAEGCNPIDLFVNASLRQHKLIPQPATEKSLLLRRVYLDLVGLPPTGDELQAFLTNEKPDAFHRVVDQLLSSPAYGERWARHWMDVWRYSDWYGRRMVPDVWNSAPQIWRWRDWIVRSLNEDKGYDRMIQEMLAGDELAAGDHQTTVATGYLIRNWYALNPNDWMRQNVEHTSKAFLGLTFNCAHCHDHKYDPITQKDYFRLRAFFEPLGIRQDRAPGEPDPGPFQEYDYSTLRKVVRLGAVQVFDQHPDAPTWYYEAGDERNRDAEAGSVPPGLPAFLASNPVQIAQVELPPAAWYPGLDPAIQASLLQEARATRVEAEAALRIAREERTETTPALEQEVAVARAALDAFPNQTKALAGEQSLLFDAVDGRRILNRSLDHVKSLPDGATLTFHVQIIEDAHFNFQLAQDCVKGLTAGYVAFDRGRIRSYQPGTFTEFDAGHYEFESGQDRFRVTIVLQPTADRGLLTVRCLSNDQLLVSDLPVAINGWNPAGDPTQAITFDAHTGSVAMIDQISLTSLTQTADGNNTTASLAQVGFEPPVYVLGEDIVNVDGWSASTFCRAPATSTITSGGSTPELRAAMQRLRVAGLALAAAELKVTSAEAGNVAAVAQLASLQARLAAESAIYLDEAADTDELVKRASQAEREAEVTTAQATLLTKQLLLAEAEGNQAASGKIEAARKALDQARAESERLAHAAQGSDGTHPTYSPLSSVYPSKSTGRRSALAAWITSRRNPLTARVAVNHIWMRHFHAPLVATVFDFGMKGARPTHPALLDWLAVELMETSWSMKHLHRLIVTSQAYQRSSTTHSASSKSDPENSFLWRMNTGRMEAEVVRDSLLYCGEELDLTLGGQELENAEALTTQRRTLYYSCQPEVDGRSQLGAVFDAPDANGCYRRTRTIVPQQALALTNSRLVHQVSSGLEQKLSSLPESEDPDFITAAYRRLLARTPSEAEMKLCKIFLREQESSAAARAGLIRVLLNHNDFVTIR